MPKLELLSANGISPAVIELIESAPLPGLDSNPQNETTRAAIRSLIKSESLQGTLHESGLWLLAGELDLSHEVSQSNDSAEGSFWHGIMHRREGDFGNAKYWFRRVGKHPVHEELAKCIERNSSDLCDSLPLNQLTDPEKSPFALVDSCQSALGSKPDQKESLERICWWQWELLYASC